MLTAFAEAVISVSAVDVDTQCWSLEHQLVGVSPIHTMNLVDDLLLSSSPA